MAEQSSPPGGHNGVRLAFGQTAIHFGGKYLGYIFVVGLIWIAPHALTFWSLSNLYDQMDVHRIEVAKFLSAYAGKHEIKEHLTLMIEAH